MRSAESVQPYRSAHLLQTRRPIVIGRDGYTSIHADISPRIGSGTERGTGRNPSPVSAGPGQLGVAERECYELRRIARPLAHAPALLGRELAFPVRRVAMRHVCVSRAPRHPVVGVNPADLA